MSQLVDIMTQTRATLAAVANIGRVGSRIGDTGTWIDRPRPKQAYWEVTTGTAPEEDWTLGGKAHRDVTVWVRGWMPFDYALNTEASWYALVDAVCDALRNEEFLNGVANETGNPNIVEPRDPNKPLEVLEGGGKADGVACHYVVIEWRVGCDINYTRS